MKTILFTNFKKKSLKLLPAVIIVASQLFVVNANSADDNFQRIGTLTNAQLSKLTEDLGAAYSYKAVDGGETGGIVGISVGISTHFTDVNNPEIYKQANDNSSTQINTTRIVVEKGLPGGIDIGASFTKIESGSLAGVQGRIALLEDGITTPAVSLRANYSTTLDSSNISFSSIGLETIMSKQIILVTPYIGAGVYQSKLEAKSGSLENQTETQTRIFGGGKVSFGIAELALEIEKFGDTETKSLRLSFGI